MAPLICLITPGHLASTPRLVKNADALAEAGYRVHVIAGRHFPPADPLDAEIARTARWEYTTINYCGGPAASMRKLLRAFARRSVGFAPAATVSFAARAHHAESLHFATVAARQPAQLFLGHCLAALPAAAFAAQNRRVPFGFDAEDFHDAETPEALALGAERTSRRILQARLLPECRHLTAASPLITQHIGRTYGVHPITVLNVFPRAYAPATPVATQPVSSTRPARFYWFSQTVGPGRGLEAVLAIAAKMRTPVELQLRGFVTAGYEASLRRLAAGSPHVGMTFLPPASPHEMARLAADADLGLATEETFPPNRDLCLTNKIFIFLLAGIPQLLSRTAAQTALAPELGDAALLCDLSEVEHTARKLDDFLADSARVAAARRAAWELAQRRFCWEVERSALLESVRRVVPL